MPRNRSLTKGRWRAYALSILLHSAIVAGAVYGWFSWKHSAPPVATLAIEATVVDERVLKGIASKPEPPPPEPVPEPAPEPEPAPVEEQGPPKPDPAELERKEAERLAQEQQQKEEQEKKAAQELKEREDAERVEAEKQAEAKAAAEKAAAEKAAEEKARVARQAELQRALEAEERGNAARNSDEAMRWHAQIVARIQQKWIKPPSAPTGISCIVSVTQVPGGEVTDVRVNSCSIDDAAFRESVEAAVYRATPLPMPPAGVPFERKLELTFAPKS
jgi:colicin import membrane protein